MRIAFLYQSIYFKNILESSRVLEMARFAELFYLLLFNSSQMFKISLLYNNIIRNNLGDWMRNRIVIPINTSPLVLLYTLYDYVKAPSQWRTNDQVERNRNVIISSKV